MTEERISRQLAKKLGGLCIYSGCHEFAKDDAAYCAHHHEQVKENDREWRAAQRRKRKAGRCLDCGARCGAWRRCQACRAKQARNRRRVDDSERRVDSDGADPGPWKLEHHKDGYAPRRRYTGRGRHGGVTREEMDDALRIDLRDAVARVEHVRLQGLAMLRELEAEVGTHSAKREARIIAADPLGVAMRMIAGVFAELHPDGWDVIKDWARGLE